MAEESIEEKITKLNNDISERLGVFDFTRAVVLLGQYDASLSEYLSEHPGLEEEEFSTFHRFHSVHNQMYQARTLLQQIRKGLEWAVIALDDNELVPEEQNRRLLRGLELAIPAAKQLGIEDYIYDASYTLAHRDPERFKIPRKLVLELDQLTRSYLDRCNSMSAFFGLVDLEGQYNSEFAKEQIMVDFTIATIMVLHDQIREFQRIYAEPSAFEQSRMKTNGAVVAFNYYGIASTEGILTPQINEVWQTMANLIGLPMTYGHPYYLVAQ